MGLMHFDVVTLFPEMVATIAEFGVVGRARRNELVSLDYENPRDHTSDVHRTVDDRPYGGGPGMVMKYEPLAGALAAARQRAPEGSPVVYLSPQGAVFDQAVAKRFAALPGLILLAGRYEGVDERFIERHVDEELSLGDFVLSGGEVAAMAVIDEFLIMGGFNRGLPTYTWTVYMWHLAFNLGNWPQGYAAAIGWIGAAAMLVVVAILFYISRNRDSESWQWN